MGYTEAQIIHRLSISLSEDENRHSNSIRFIDITGKIIYEKPAGYSKLVYAERNDSLGKGYYRGGELINEPFDFSTKNRISLSTLHSILRSILFPDDIEEKQRFDLVKEDYDFLRKYMSMRPAESKWPEYNPENYWDNYVKVIFYGTAKTKPETDIRIFNKLPAVGGSL
jgi:hypothetical protein